MIFLRPSSFGAEITSRFLDLDIVIQFEVGSVRAKLLGPKQVTSMITSINQIDHPYHSLYLILVFLRLSKNNF